MWRTILLFSVLLYTVVTHVTTAPAYFHRGRGPSYTISNAPETRHIHQKQPYIEVQNSTYHGSGPREEARAMCSVKTQEVNATANATITRRLHGVVTSKELRSSIQRLEVIIFGQMQQLWQSLDALRAQLAGSNVGGLIPACANNGRRCGPTCPRNNNKQYLVSYKFNGCKTTCRY